MAEYGSVFQNEPVDVSEEWEKQENHFFVGQRLARFDPRSASGEILWKGLSLKQRVSYHQLTLQFEDYRVWEDTPPGEYEDDRALPFSLDFVSPRTLRMRLSARPQASPGEPSLMLIGEPPADDSWEASDDGSRVVYEGKYGSVVVERDPWHVELRDAAGRRLTRTRHRSDSRGVVDTRPTPFSFVRNTATLHRHVAASFELRPGEKLYGCGESFTRLDKRGQKLLMWTCDAYGAEGAQMYKPVPFFVSSHGYGMFAHTSASATFDLGHTHDEAAVMYLGDDQLDLFLFLGSLKEVLSEYTALTGRAAVPPLWTFGLWMGRESYSSEEEVRNVAKKLREQRIPSDVIHLDVGWTEVPHRNDFRFSPSRFPNPEKMLSDLKKDGFRVSLWQLPYFNPRNELHSEAVEGGHVVLDASGEPPVDDAVVDFSSPEAERWYGEKLEGLLRMGVGVFTADFGEAAPLSGMYASKKGGFHEHNLYPLRYNKAVAEATERVTGDGVIFARSAWAGSQRYPLHWGGDAEVSDNAIAGTLRGGLSLGLCGFSFWSHFIGGFAYPTPPDLYLRWLAFGVLSSHARCHGAPPTEPWEYEQEWFTDGFRRVVEMRYRLMPYVYAQATLAAREGHPMLRALFFEHPEDPTSWLIEDQYMFGTDFLVAPLLEDAPERDVYLPPGLWTDYEGGEVHAGSGWRRLRAGEIPAVMLVREGAAIPHVPLAQSTDAMDWSEMHLLVFGDGDAATGLFRLPEGDTLHSLRLRRAESGFVLEDDPLSGRVRWNARAADDLRDSPPRL